MTATTEQSVATRLSTINRLLPVWIGLAMAGGLLLGRVFPGLNDWLDNVKVRAVSLTIAIGQHGSEPSTNFHHRRGYTQLGSLRQCS